MMHRRMIKYLMQLAKEYKARSRELRETGDFERALDFEIFAGDLRDIANTFKVW